MDWLLSMRLNNAVVASVPALAAILLWRRSGKAALVHALWVLALLKLVTPPVVDVPLHVLSGGQASSAVSLAVDDGTVVLGWDGGVKVGTLGVSSAPAIWLDQTESRQRKREAAPIDVRMNWIALLIGIWVIGAVGIAFVTGGRIWRFSKWLGTAVPADRAMLARARGVAGHLGISHGRMPEIHVLKGAVSPMLWAWLGRARLYLPAELCRRLSSDQLDSLLAHEMAHFARRDHWVRYLELAVGVIYWWHPLVWIGRRQLRQAEEQCCDAWVLHALPGRAKAYATALVDAVDYLANESKDGPACAPRGVRLASGAVSVSAKQLKRRLVMILKNRQSRCLSTLGRVGVLALGLAVMPMTPKWLAADEGLARPAEEKREKSINGQFASLDGTTLVLTVGENGREMRVPTEGATSVSIDGTAAKLSDLKPGHFVAARQVDGLTTRIEARAGRGMARFGAAAEDGVRREGEPRAEPRREGEPRAGVARDGEARREGARDGDLKREGIRRDGDARPAGPRDGEVRREGPRDGEAKPAGPRDGDLKRDGLRDGDLKREGVRRDGEAKPAGPRDGEIRRDGARDGDIKREAVRRDGEARLAEVRREGEARPVEARREGEARPVEGRREGAGTLRIATPRGRVEKIDDGKIVMVGREGRAGDAIATDSKTRVWVNGKSAELSDIKPGMMVTLRTVEGVTTEVDARNTGMDREAARPREGDRR